MTLNIDLFKGITEVIIYSGYENRLTKDSVEWFTNDDGDYFIDTTYTPLTAGGRIITPEEVDDSLSEALDGDNYDNPFYQNISKSLTTEMCDIDKLFEHYKEFEDEHRDISPEIWRDMNMNRRHSLIEEVKQICYANGYERFFDDGLCVRCNTNDYCRIFDLDGWLCEQHYCACMSVNSIQEMKYIQGRDYKILIVTHDAEGG